MNDRNIHSILTLQRFPRRIPRLPRRAIILETVFSLLLSAPFLGVADEPAFVFSLDDRDQATLGVTTWPPDAGTAARTGILLWSEDGEDRWTALPLSAADSLAARRKSSPGIPLTASRGESSSERSGSLSLAISLDQLTGGEILRGLRGGDLLTPAHQQLQLDGRLTLRRLPRDDEPRFPAEDFVLRSQTEELAQIRFPAGLDTLHWVDIRVLPAEIANGLRPGPYALRSKSSEFSCVFTVASPDTKRDLLALAESVVEFTGSRSDPLYLQLAVEGCLSATDEDDSPRPCLADALDILDRALSADPLALTPYLRSLRARIVSQLKGDPEPPLDATDDNTGIASIDAARQLLAQGQWTEAEEILRPRLADSDDREATLAELYLAVVGSESGQATAAETGIAFRAALAKLSPNEPQDVFRARSNYVTYLLTRVQDLLYNHAFQAVSGVRGPLTLAAAEWRRADQLLAECEASSAGRDPRQTAVVRVQRARLSLLLDDLLRLLNSTLSPEVRFTAGQTAARVEAKRQLELVAQLSPKEVDRATFAAALELAARGAHREGNADSARELARKARASHLERGSLAGVETAERLLGLADMLLAKNASSPAAKAEAFEAAARHLQVAQLLSNVLRERFPGDASGLRRAGFFARRVYVSEQLMELRIEQGNAVAALECCEDAKSRTLEEALADFSDAASPEPATARRRSVGDMLARWPPGTAVVEYYLGAERAWIFVVDTRGGVHVTPVLDEGGKPLSSTELLARVHPFLRELDGAAGKLLERARATGRFDGAWQDELHAFHQLLLPESVRAAIGDARQVVIVPHHLLHYFPFAALVTRRDEQPRGALEMPQPRFLADEPYDLNYAPSLAVWYRLREVPSPPVEQAQVLGISEFATARPLPGVEQDLRNFRAALGARVQTALTGKSATEAEVRELLRQPGLMFLATHGKNIPDEPLASYILCHAGAGQDGRLTAAEILAAPVGASIVVMSACYSGLADRSPLPGDDLFGLQRVFLQRGARSVVAGLWDVYDETGALLMQRFFQELSQGKSVPASLAGAQRDFLRQRRAEGPGDPWIHPYFWAVYKSTGSDLVHLNPAARRPTNDRP